jgi:hypothetical protein
MRYPNGSEAVLSSSPWQQLIGVKRCPCSDGRPRRVTHIGVPDTFWTAPGRVVVKGKTVTGFVSCDERGYTFHANAFGKNAGLLPTNNEHPPLTPYATI